jgi:diguanylate cyclase
LRGHSLVRATHLQSLKAISTKKQAKFIALFETFGLSSPLTEVMIAQMSIHQALDPVAAQQRWHEYFTQGEDLRLANPMQALPHARAAYELAQVLNDELTLALSERLLGRILGDTSEPREGLKHALNALKRLQALDKPYEIALTQSAVGFLYGVLGDYEAALSQFEPAQRSAAALGDEILLLRVLGNTAVTYANMRRFDEARSLMERALSLARAANNQQLVLRSLANIGYVDVEQARDLSKHGNPEEAQRVFGRAHAKLAEALHMVSQGLSVFDEGIVHFNLGSVYAETGQLDLAQQHLELALQAYQASGNQNDIFDADILKGSVLSKRGEHAQALEILKSCVETCAESEIFKHAQRMHAWHEYSACAERAGDLALALSAIKQAHAIEHASLDKRVADRAAAFSIKLEMERAQMEADILRIHAEQLVDQNTELAGHASVLNRQANEDVLTELSNRRYFDEQFPKLVQSEFVHSMYVALVDLDHFKRINDTYSHAVGDQVLRQVSAILRAHSRTDDLVARYGGEEFVLLLLHVNAEQAKAACERLRMAVEERNWSAMAPGLAVTTSIGLAKVDPTLSPAQNIHAADLLLYRAKEEGRNRVCM